MTAATVEVPLSPDVKEKLTRMAARMGVEESALVEEAIAEFVARDSNAVEAIERALDDLRNGRVTAHEDIMANVEAVIAAEERERRSQ